MLNLNSFDEIFWAGVGFKSSSSPVCVERVNNFKGIFVKPLFQNVNLLVSMNLLRLCWFWSENQFNLVEDFKDIFLKLISLRFF